MSDWEVVVGDVSLAAARERIGNSARGRALAFDIHDESSSAIIRASDLVISVLPAVLHPVVARKCILLRKHLLTASYVSDEMKSLDTEVQKANLLFLNECEIGRAHV